MRLLTLSFEEGEIDFSGVFLLQGVLVGAQNNLAQAQGEIVTSLISLYKALGGGWEVRFRGFASQPLMPERVEPVEISPVGKEMFPLTEPDADKPLTATESNSPKPPVLPAEPPRELLNDD